MYSAQSAKEKAHYLEGAGEEWFIILAISDAMIRLSEWRLKLVLSIPSVSIFAFLSQRYDILLAECEL